MAIRHSSGSTTFINIFLPIIYFTSLPVVALSARGGLLRLGRTHQATARGDKSTFTLAILKLVCEGGSSPRASRTSSGRAVPSWRTLNLISRHPSFWVTDRIEGRRLTAFFFPSLSLDVQYSLRFSSPSIFSGAMVWGPWNCT